MKENIVGTVKNSNGDTINVFPSDILIGKLFNSEIGRTVIAQQRNNLAHEVTSDTATLLKNQGVREFLATIENCIELAKKGDSND